MGNPWLFRSLAALEAGAPDPGPPTLDERHRIWRRHTELVLTHSPEKMRLHELRKTWPGTRAVSTAARRCASAASRSPTWRRCSTRGSGSSQGWPSSRRARRAVPATVPADPVAKSVARNGRRGGAHVEADECVAASS